MPCAITSCLRRQLRNKKSLTKFLQFYFCYKPTRTLVNWKICEFSFSRDGKKFEALGEGFKAKAGIWIGAKVGLFALGPMEANKRGHADYDWFRISLPERSSQTRARAQ